MLKLMQRITAGTLSILLTLAMALTTVGHALAQAEDTEAPVLIHRQIDSGVAGELQTFLARVSDDFGIETVVLYYRQTDRGEFNILPMRPLLDSIGEYMIAVETSVGSYPGLQYYIEAVDAAGNIANRGFAYAPIVLPLSAPANVPELATSPAPAVEPQRSPAPVAQQGSSGVNMTTVLLGVGALIAVGALAAAGSSGDEPDTNPSTGTPPAGQDTVTLTIVSDVPSAN